MSRIMYTYTDEAPMLATHSLLPIISAFARAAEVDVELHDISLAARVLAAFNDQLPAEQRVPDALAELGELAKTPDANIIKLPNISASVPQLLATIKELRALGYNLPDYPENPETAAEKDARARYDRVKGSAVNPVLREGNSDRRAPIAVKNYARKHPHRMGAWAKDSKTRIATMSAGDFRHNEKSVTLSKDSKLDIVFVGLDGTEAHLNKGIPAGKGDIFDSTYMSAVALDDFLKAQIETAKATGVLFSVHLKATMMKVSDPVIFGHVVRAMLPATFERYGATFQELGLSANNGLAAILNGIDGTENAAEIKASIENELATGPALAMVNSDRGITNLHVPSDVIIDASMPAMIRTSGHMWDAAGNEADTLALIPDSTYAHVYETVVEDCQENGAFDPVTLGTVPNIGLMAQKAEEYGSHDKTHVLTAAGRVEVRDETGTVLMQHQVAAGDIFRACQVKAAPIQDWVELAVRRVRASQMPAIFWLDSDRAHDAELIKQVQSHLDDLGIKQIDFAAASEIGPDTTELPIAIMDLVPATALTLQRFRAGKDTIAVTGNVLRDYLTDLFPIMEVGTSAKMLSIVPLMAGGGLYETGAGGSAPKHVQQLQSENYLRWDSLGEFLALAESLRQAAAEAATDPAQTAQTPAAVLADALDLAIQRLLEENRSPARKLGSIDNRGSHFYLAQYWARALADQKQDAALTAKFAEVAAALEANEETIVHELLAVQGKPVDLGGYYRPDSAKATAVMRPAATFNQIIDELK